MKKIAPFFICLFLGFSRFAFADTAEEEILLKQRVLSVHPTIPGWCSQKKAEAMMDLILKVRPEVCVEIGVFGGASLYPTASTLKYLGKGVVYAIDPWDNYECARYFPEGSEHRVWWQNIDLQWVFHSFINLIKSHQLENYCVILIQPSSRAASKIGPIDILHIDSTHCDESALIDVINYEPKVKIGGFIWFDGWSTCPHAFEFLKKTCEVRKVIDGGKCILLEKVTGSV